MISFDGSSAPMWFIVIVLGAGVLCAAGTGFFSELTRRNSTLKDLQIIKFIREDSTSDNAKAVADEYEKKVLKRVDNYLHKRNALALTIGVLVRGTPFLLLALTIWPFSMIYGVYHGETFSVLYVVQSFMSWLLAGLVAEGIVSVLRPFITPLSERWDRITGAGEKGSKGDTNNEPSSKKNQ